MNAYAYNPYAYARPVAPAALVPDAYYNPGAIAVFGQDPNAPAQPGTIDKAKAWFQTDSVGGLSRGAWLAIGVGGATLAYTLSHYGRRAARRRR